MPNKWWQHLCDIYVVYSMRVAKMQFLVINTMKCSIRRLKVLSTKKNALEVRQHVKYRQQVEIYLQLNSVSNGRGKAVNFICIVHCSCIASLTIQLLSRLAKALCLMTVLCLICNKSGRKHCGVQKLACRVKLNPIYGLMIIIWNVCFHVFFVCESVSTVMLIGFSSRWYIRRSAQTWSISNQS